MNESVNELLALQGGYCVISVPHDVFIIKGRSYWLDVMTKEFPSY